MAQVGVGDAQKMEEGLVAKPVAPEPQKKEEVLTVLGKQITPVLLAFLSGWYDIVCFRQYKSYALMPTGNTVNLCMQMGNGDYSNVKFLLATVANYCGGMGLYKFLDLKLKGLNCNTSAAVVFGLHAASDQLRVAMPDSRFTLVPLCISGGFFNALSAGKLGGIMAMMNGQYQGLMAAVAQMAVTGVDKAQAAAVLKGLRVISAFCLGLFLSAYNKSAPSSQVAKRKFSLIGAIYAAILVLHELPRSTFSGK